MKTTHLFQAVWRPPQLLPDNGINPPVQVVSNELTLQFTAAIISTALQYEYCSGRSRGTPLFYSARRLFCMQNRFFILYARRIFCAQNRFFIKIGVKILLLFCKLFCKQLTQNDAIWGCRKYMSLLK